MANALYDKGREKFLKGEVSWNTDTIDIALVKIGAGAGEYAVNLATHDFFDDVDAGAVVARLSDNTVEDDELTAKTTTAGVADAADAVLESVAGDECGAIIILGKEATDGTSPLLAYIDTGVNLPITPTGANITIEWDAGANRIFKL